MDELKSGTLPEPVELASSELAFVAGGQAISFLKQMTLGYTSAGTQDKVTWALDLVTAGLVQPVTRSADKPSLQPLQIKTTAQV